MPSTERLYAKSDEAAHQLKCIAKARKAAYRQIESVAHELMMETGCTAADANHLLDHVSDGLDDMLADITAKWEDERDDADNEIADIEERDLMLSSPVVL